MYDPYQDFVKSVLPNGLEIHSVFLDRPWVKVGIVVHSGSREDPPGKSGMAHFVEHLVSENIPPSFMQKSPLREFLHDYGGSTDFGATSYFTTRYGFMAPSDLGVFRDTLNVFGAMLLHGRLEKEIERERSVIHSEFFRSNPISYKLKWARATREALFKGHRLETWCEILGLPDEFLSLSQSDLQAFYDTHYVPRNISIVAVGGFSRDQIVSEIEKSVFGFKKEGSRSAFPPPFSNIVVPTNKAQIIRASDLVDFKMDQLGYNASWALPGSFPLAAIKVFTTMLYDILFSEVREKRGLSYSITPDYVEYQDVYKYNICGQLNPVCGSYIDDLIQECVQKVSLEHECFKRTVAAKMRRCYMLDFSGKKLLDSSVDDLVLYRRIVPIADDYRSLQGVSFDHILELVKFLSHERKHLLLIHP